LRRKLARFFEWRGAPFPEERADETFNRVARKLEEGVQILNPGGYCNEVARLVLLESFKRPERKLTSLEEMDSQKIAELEASTPNFEQHYLAHPDRRERVRFAQTLLAKIDQQSESAAEPIAASRKVAGKTSWRQKLSDFFQPGNWQLNWAASMALLLLAVTAGMLYLRTRPNPTSQGVVTRETPVPPTPSPSPSGAVQPSVLPSPIAAEKPGSVFATLALTVGGLRGEGNGQAARLALSPNVDFVGLQLRLRRLDYPSYRVSLSPIGGSEVWRKQGLKSTLSATGENLPLVDHQPGRNRRRARTCGAAK